MNRRQTCHESGIEKRIGLSADRARQKSSAMPPAPSTMSGTQTAMAGETSWPFAIWRPMYSIT